MRDSQEPELIQDFTVLVLNVAPELEENLIDYLLSFEQIEGFTSLQVYGHGEHRRLSIAEQVSGRRRRVQCEIFLDNGDIAVVLAGLGDAVGKDIVYWQQSAWNFGRIDA